MPAAGRRGGGRRWWAPGPGQGPGIGPGAPATAGRRGHSAPPLRSQRVDHPLRHLCAAARRGTQVRCGQFRPHNRYCLAHSMHLRESSKGTSNHTHAGCGNTLESASGRVGIRCRADASCAFLQRRWAGGRCTVHLKRRSTPRHEAPGFMPLRKASVQMLRPSWSVNLTYGF
jgi:hypothetical protein